MKKYLLELDSCHELIGTYETPEQAMLVAENLAREHGSPMKAVIWDARPATEGDRALWDCDDDIDTSKSNWYADLWVPENEVKRFSTSPQECQCESGIVRSLGRDNDEIISDCRACTPTPSTPQPSAEAMAAAIAINAVNKARNFVLLHPPSGITEPLMPADEAARIIDAELAALRAENESSKKAVEVIQHAHAEISGAYFDRTVELTSLRQRLERAEEALKECAGERVELINGVCHAVSMVGGIVDEFFDEDPPEGSEGSPPRAELRNLSAHLQGTLIDKTGELMPRDKYAAMSATSAKPGEGEKQFMTANQLIEQLIFKGGAIVGTADCSEMEIAFARADGRFAMAETFGLVRRTQHWLALQKARELAYPADSAAKPGEKEGA